MLKMPYRKAIFTMELRTEPSMCMVQPMGSTRSLMSLGTPMLSQDSLFTGMVAAEDWVAKAVMAGGKMFLNIIFTPSLPPARKEYSGKKMMKYRAHRG